MMRWILRLFVVLVPLGLALFWWLTMPRSYQGPLPARAADLANGQVMFWAGGCASCHAAPKSEERTKLGGGLGLETAFGTFHVPNISPHKSAGIGAWSERDFLSAMLHGTSPDGSHYYPAFPYTSYGKMRVDDARDLFAYLMSLPEDATPSRPHQLGFVFSIRRGLGLWKLLFADTKPYLPPTGASEQVARGGYLVEAAGHCAECHSARNMLGGIVPGQRYAGGIDAEGKGWVPNISQARDGLRDWSAKDIEEALYSGMTPKDDFLGGSMGSVVKNMGKLPKAELEAIAAYIKALPARETVGRPSRR